MLHAAAVCTGCCCNTAHSDPVHRRTISAVFVPGAASISGASTPIMMPITAAVATYSRIGFAASWTIAAPCAHALTGVGRFYGRLERRHRDHAAVVKRANPKRVLSLKRQLSRSDHYRAAFCAL